MFTKEELTEMQSDTWGGKYAFSKGVRDIIQQLIEAMDKLEVLGKVIDVESTYIKYKEEL